MARHKPNGKTRQDAAIHMTTVQARGRPANEILTPCLSMVPRLARAIQGKCATVFRPNCVNNG